MPNLRSMIDGTTIFAAAPKASKPSPVAQHVSDHIQDPVGATKEGFEDLQQKKLEYDQARSNMQMQLIPVQGVLDHVNQTHGMNNDNPDVDENGQPIAPGNPMATGQQAPAVPGRGMPPKPGMPATPGMAPSMGQQRPPMMGMPAPGGKPVNGMPQPKGSAPVAKPGGAVKPKAKPGGASGRQVKVHVTAGSDLMPGARYNLESAMGAGILRSGKILHSGDAVPITNDVVQANKLIKPCVKCGKMHEVGACSMKAGKVEDVDCAECDMDAAGSTESAIKGWGTRGRGNPTAHASEKELKAHKKKMKSSMGHKAGLKRNPNQIVSPMHQDFPTVKKQKYFESV